MAGQQWLGQWPSAAWPCFRLNFPLMSVLWVWVTWHSVMCFKCPACGNCGIWEMKSVEGANRRQGHNYKVSVVHARTNCKYCKTACTWERKASHVEVVCDPKYGAQEEIRDNPNKQNLATSHSEEGFRESSLFVKKVLFYAHRNTN